jgi:hypothetical protein
MKVMGCRSIDKLSFFFARPRRAVVGTEEQHFAAALAGGVI